MRTIEQLELKKTIFLQGGLIPIYNFITRIKDNSMYKEAEIIQIGGTTQVPQG